MLNFQTGKRRMSRRQFDHLPDGGALSSGHSRRRSEVLLGKGGSASLEIPIASASAAARS